MPKVIFRPNPVPPPFVPPVPITNPLTFIARENNSSVAFNIVGSVPRVSLSYSRDNGETWNPYTFNESVNLESIGDSVMFKGDNNSFSINEENFIQVEISGEIASSGSVMFLLDSQGNIKPLSNYCFYKLFADCTSLTQAPSLPATTLAENCYKLMFADCESLTQAPALPATTLASHCYSNMFANCISLTQAPTLPATTLASHCYYAMFYRCTSLTQAPALPATMMASFCYAEMFVFCSSLTQAPSLPATTLADNCYESMFADCESLTLAPALPATTLASHCYEYMFSYCISLSQAPVLLATTLVEYCYSNMFKGCTSLNYVQCNATNISASGCLDTWLESVSASGTFRKNTSMTDWPSGASGIPNGWTIEDV